MIVEVILTVVMICVCVAALTVSLINRKRVGCQKPNCIKKEILTDFLHRAYLVISHTFIIFIPNDKRIPRNVNHTNMVSY